VPSPAALYILEKRVTIKLHAGNAIPTVVNDVVAVNGLSDRNNRWE
jgi:hypothetical protein